MTVTCNGGKYGKKDQQKKSGFGKGNCLAAVYQTGLGRRKDSLQGVQLQRSGHRHFSLRQVSRAALGSRTWQVRCRHDCLFEGNYETTLKLLFGVFGNFQ